MTNSRDSGNLEFSDAQNQMILHMAGAGLEVPEPVPNLCGQLQSLESVGATRNIVRCVNSQHLLEIISVCPDCSGSSLA